MSDSPPVNIIFGFSLPISFSPSTIIPSIALAKPIIIPDLMHSSVVLPITFFGVSNEIYSIFEAFWNIA